VSVTFDAREPSYYERIRQGADRPTYAEGTREPADCRKCGQPIWIVYHGRHANHTIEPRAVEALHGDGAQPPESEAEGAASSPGSVGSVGEEGGRD
jgi:hypothetical protein